MKFYKVVARPSLLYGSETWVTTKRDVTGLEAAEMDFVRSVTGYTRLDKIRNEIFGCVIPVVLYIQLSRGFCLSQNTTKL